MRLIGGGCCPCLPAKGFSRLTSAGAEVDASDPSRKGDRWIYLGHSKIRLALPSLDEGGSSDTGLRLWTASLILAGYLEEPGNDCVRGLSVVELGTGVTALPTIVAARAGAASVLATDYCSSLADAARANLAANGVSRIADAGVLEWDAAFVNAASGRRWDVVLFADTVYTLEMGDLLARCVDSVLAVDGKAIGAMSVFRVGSAEFVRMMSRLGFVAEQLSIQETTMRRIDEGLVLGPGTSRKELEQVIEGLPATGCELVCWRRRSSSFKLPPDDTEKIHQRLAGDLEQAESKIRMSEGFEVWE